MLVLRRESSLASIVRCETLEQENRELSSGEVLVFPVANIFWEQKHPGRLFEVPLTYLDLRRETESPYIPTVAANPVLVVRQGILQCAAPPELLE